jgi:uncharacterized protein involved in exopolysaccharide biosynthesis
LEERQQNDSLDDGIDLGEIFAIFRKVWWKIVLLSLAFGIVTFVVMLQIPNTYLATAVITPSIDEKKQNPALGALAAFGVAIGGPSSIEDLESLFKSNDLTVRVFRKYNLWPIVLADKFDPATGKMNPALADRLFGNEKGPRIPGEWDAIRMAKDRLRVSLDKKSGSVTITFQSPSAEGSAGIVKHYLEEAKSRLQEEALDRAMKNKKFIEEQIGKTVDALNRDRLYALYSQEVEREMMGRNRDQFGFRVVDAPRAPDRKFKPHRGVGAILVAILSFFAGCAFFAVRGTRGDHLRNRESSG